jgi:hypothetical protein
MTDPVITLAGKEYPVPMLALKQNRVVVPACMRLRGLKPLEISQEQFDDLIDITFLGAQRGTPGLNKVDFMEMPIKTAELLMAFPVIMQQTGMFKAKEGVSDTGEAPKAGNSQTGTE